MTEPRGEAGATGNFFEDFRPGRAFEHATPRTLTTGDQALYSALYGTRFAVPSSVPFARAIGYETAPVDELLAFHVVFGKTVPDISLNAVANLGYAEGRFLGPVYPGATLRAVSDVIGVKENSDGRTGVIWVRTRGLDERDDAVLEYVRWVMIPKRDAAAPAPDPSVPALAGAVDAADLVPPPGLDLAGYDRARAGGGPLWDDLAPGFRIDHVDGMTVEEADHMTAARLYQNPARVHFNQHQEASGRFGRRIVYGGHVISLARALSFNGLANAFAVAAINAGRHVSPTFAGDTVYAWSEVVATHAFPGDGRLGAVRLRTVATKDTPARDFPEPADAGSPVVLDLDYWAWMPRRA